MEPRRIRIRKGLDLPVGGRPEQRITDHRSPSRVALLGLDSMGIKPRFTVSVGDSVKTGQPLYVDKKRPSLQFTSPGSGTVAAINRGERRALTSIIIECDSDDELTFQSYPEHTLSALNREQVETLLLSSGLWTSLRTRPFSMIPDPGSAPHALFITAMDSNPLAPSVETVLQGKEKHFLNGITALSRLTKGTIFLCKARGSTIPEAALEQLQTVEFSGPHPAGNPGTHIHFLDPVSRHRQVWYIGAQDVVAVGILFTTGRLSVARTISLAGPSVERPRLIETRIGASVDDLVSGELRSGAQRVLSGSVLSGFQARGDRAYLGRYHQQVSVIPENTRREFLGWLRPGLHQHSVKNIVLSRLLPQRLLKFDTSTHGELRAIVPTESYEKVIPLDILPTHLLRALAVRDLDEAELLGALELDEEDLALCTYVCPSKIDHGSALRKTLSLLAKEG